MTAPIVVVGPPGSGDVVVADALARAPGVTLVDGPPFPEALGLGTAASGSHRLTAADATRGARRAARRALAEAAAGDGRALLAGLRLALRVGFLDAVLDAPRFVLVHRDPAAMLGIALDAWRSGRSVSAPGLPGWDGPPWSLPLVPGWKALRGRPLEEVVALQWRAIAQALLDDLDALAPERWAAVDRAALLDDPAGELQRLCGVLDLRYDQAMLTPVEEARRRRGRSEGLAPSTMPSAAAALAAPAIDRLAQTVPASATAWSPTTDRDALRSVSSPGFADLLEGSALVVTAPDAGRLVLVRARGGVVNTDFHVVPRPGAVSADAGRVAVATPDELWEWRAEGDAFVLRTRHLVALPPVAPDARLDPDEGRALGVELPGVPTALAQAGELTFVAVSQARGRDLPVTRRRPERRCGIWVLSGGAVAGWLRFDDLVQELAGIAVIPHAWPALVAPTASA